jgi:GMP synthase (glutamine-hydrolysing)
VTVRMAGGAGEVRVLVVQHQDDCHLGWFGDWLAAGGVTADVVRPYIGDEVPADLGQWRGLVVLGGSMGAYDDDVYLWLRAVKALLRSAVRAGTPTLGICLGHQLLTVACGGRVERNPAGRVMGLVDLRLSGEGHDDDVLSAVKPPLRSARWNQDIVAELPAEASLLAVDDAGVPQAVRVGARAWGVQFHPEASPAVVRAWAARTVTGAGADGRPTPDEVAQALASVESADGVLRGFSASFAEAFTARLHAPA